MLSLVKKLVADEAGQDLAEYGIALAIIPLGAGLIALAIAGDITTVWSNAQSVISAAV